MGLSICIHTEMAPPSGPPVASSSTLPSLASTSTGVRTSARNRGAVTYVESDDDGDFKMDDRDDDADTPRRSTRSAGKRAIVSPGLQGPETQRARIDDPVCDLHLTSVFDFTSRYRTRVVHAGEGIKRANRSLAGGRLSHANSAHSRELPASHWRGGRRIWSKRARPRSWKTRHRNIQSRSRSRSLRANHPRLPNSRRARGKGVMLPVCAQLFPCFQP